MELAVYEYILSMVKDVLSVTNPTDKSFFCAARRCTAIGVGAVRYNTAIAPLSTDIDPRRGSIVSSHAAIYSCMFLSLVYSLDMMFIIFTAPMNMVVRIAS